MHSDGQPLERAYEHALTMREVTVGQIDPARSFEKLLHRDATLHPADRSAEAKMNPVPEAKMLPGPCALKIDLGRIRPLARIAISRGPEQHDASVFGQLFSTELQRHLGLSKVPLERGLEPQDLLDEVRNEFRL